MFAERYADSVNASNLMDDAFHRKTEALCASALASMAASNRELGALLMRIKFVDGIAHKDFEGRAINIAQALRIWTAEVQRKCKERKWAPVPTAEWDMHAYLEMIRLVAEMSLAYWINGNCEECSGTGVKKDQHECPACHGTKTHTLRGKKFVVDRATEMVGELEGLFQSHSSRAANCLRRVV